ncbi:MAG: hypothetical protein FJW69_10700, partial [Actinobacteria bacterium]|nr:hypothetical protein [Actinomycetota bacterium]
YGYDPSLTAQQIGQTWLNYLIEERTILWWGGMGNSTEHTAYLRLKAGIPAPKSGSIQLNSKVVAEQIGAQIFIDAWAMACPGDPEKAVNFAKRPLSLWNQWLLLNLIITGCWTPQFHLFQRTQSYTA